MAIEFGNKLLVTFLYVLYLQHMHTSANIALNLFIVFGVEGNHNWIYFRKQPSPGGLRGREH